MELTRPYDLDDPVMKAAYEAGMRAARKELTRTVGAAPTVVPGVAGMATVVAGQPQLIYASYITTGPMSGFAYSQDDE